MSSYTRSGVCAAVGVAGLAGIYATHKLLRYYYNSSNSSQTSRTADNISQTARKYIAQSSSSESTFPPKKLHTLRIRLTPKEGAPINEKPLGICIRFYVPSRFKLSTKELHKTLPLRLPGLESISQRLQSKLLEQTPAVPSTSPEDSNIIVKPAITPLTPTSESTFSQNKVLIA
ncbi:MAG: hypothetical protein ACI9S8_001921 [Chlamydiales bacterium]|jgi:hypothetical protein